MTDITKSTEIIRSALQGMKPQVAIVLGSGLGPLVEAVENPTTLSYEDLPGFPRPSVEGHSGSLTLGRINGIDLLVFQGRSHYYENGNASGMLTVIEVIRALGCAQLILTNAAGSLNKDAGPGSLMLITDHINYSGLSPLIGARGNDRFVDLTDAYDPSIRRRLKHTAQEQQLPLHEGVYMWFSGPNFETPAEIRAAGILGADAVGMSTVPEVILARRAGIPTAALSIITNYGAGMSDTALTHEQTMRNAKVAAENLIKLISCYLKDLGNTND
ncbi:purine-nucleoside phosphorylase [Kiloniella laminariae]|uniref:purine-nucleoside phosphorylase n=1 Tax=Kiloniella laminariae TaxID=454162 RepID=UPI0003739E09|nr:purine-nucleoside phosphorylase [Kiloniella laminariae]